MSKQENATWIIEDDLKEVFQRLQSIDQVSRHEIDGEVMAVITKRLLISEAKVGGPYKELDGTIDPKTNRLIDDFMAKRGINIPSLSAFRGVDSIATNNEEPQNNSSFNAIRDRLLRDIRTVDSEFGKELEAAAEKILKTKMRFEIGLISSYFNNSLLEGRASLPQTRTLGIANFYTWIAYSIYDDFIDEEGTPGLLPVANYACRRAIRIYESLWMNKHSQALIESTFLMMDIANSWEVREARAKVERGYIHISQLPDYQGHSILSQRSLAHILGPLLIALNSKSIKASERNNIEDALNSFLIARQLNDDIHDWHEDFRDGHISSVVALILKDNNMLEGKYKISALLPRLDTYFWEKGLDKICNDTLKHLALSRDLLASCKTIKNDNPLMPLIDRLEQAMNKSLLIHADSKKFLKKYKSITT